MKIQDIITYLEKADNHIFIDMSLYTRIALRSAIDIIGETNKYPSHDLTAVTNDLFIRRI